MTTQVPSTMLAADAGIGTSNITDSAVTTAKIADSNVTAVKIAASAVTPAKLSQPLTRGTAVATTSGVAVDYTSIPSWVSRITVMFNAVSTSGSSTIILQLGTSGGFETTGYVATGWDGTNLQTTTGIALSGSVASTNTRSGVFTLANVSGNVWVGSGVIIRTDSATGNFSGGNKTLSGVLDRIRITTVNGTDTFDAGSINILYE